MTARRHLNLERLSKRLQRLGRYSLSAAPSGERLSPASIEAVSSLPALLTTKQATAFLGVTDRTLRRWVGAGRIRVLKTSPTGGGRVRFPRSEIARLLTSMEWS